MPNQSTEQPNSTVKKTPEKQKQENGKKPPIEHCKKIGLFQNYDSPPNDNTDQDTC